MAIYNSLHIIKLPDMFENKDKFAEKQFIIFLRDLWFSQDTRK
jgi:predicted AAA+ superfamily ATPase